MFLAWEGIFDSDVVVRCHTHWSADAFERPLDINLIHIGANKQADCRVFIICLISLLSQHDAAKAPTQKAMENLHQPGGVFRNSILHQPGAFLQDIDFQFFAFLHQLGAEFLPLLEYKTNAILFRWVRKFALIRLPTINHYFFEYGNY